MMKNFTYSVMVVLLFVSSSLFAQTRSVSGIVKDPAGIAIPGATVKITGTTKGTTTGGNGEFKLMV